jgi:lipopolysaccharide biosynthesis glycosyltransferase
MATAMVSILKTANKSDELYFYILCDKISNDSKHYISSLKIFKDFEVEFLDVNINDFISFPAGGAHISNTTYFRYKIAELCPSISKIIYLDCDVIVKQSFAELFETDIEGYYLAGVEDIGYYYYRQYNPEFIYKDFFYVNAGVFLINLDAWRGNNIYTKLMAFTINESDKIKIGDQDVINAVCKGKIKELDYKWNVQDSFYRSTPERRYNPNRKKIIQAAKFPAIIHYTYKKKPWNTMSMPRTKDWLYFDYLRIDKVWSLKFVKDYFISTLCGCLYYLKNFIRFILDVRTIKYEKNYRIVKILFFKIKRKR